MFYIEHSELYTVRKSGNKKLMLQKITHKRCTEIISLRNCRTSTYLELYYTMCNTHNVYNIQYIQCLDRSALAHHIYNYYTNEYILSH